MAETRTQKAVCRECGKPFEVELFPVLINVGREPSYKEDIKNGSLFTRVCPHCGAVNMVLAPLLYHDPDARIIIWLNPQGRAQGQDFTDTMKADDLKGYTLRKVEDAGSLIEKVRIFEAGLDDAAVEMCKFVSGQELNAKGLRFRGFAGADNEMEFIFPRNGQMHSVKVGFNVYEDSRAILARNPSVVPGGLFPKIDSDWTEQVFG